MMKHLQMATGNLGLPPGTLVHAKEDSVIPTRIHLIDFDEQNFKECEIDSIEELIPFLDTPTVTWIHIIGNSDITVLEKVGSLFGIHELVLEDVMNTGHRPKIEDYGNYVFFVSKIIREQQGKTVFEQLSLIVGKHYIISFQESEFDMFASIRERIRSGKGKIRKNASDYLAYALIDIMVDNYFVVLEKLGEQIEVLESEVMLNPSTKTVHLVQSFKKRLLFIRKSVWPLREIISSLERGESEIFQSTTLIYIRDVYDHTIQVIDTVETYRDMVSGLLDIYLASISNRMNEVMKVLTIISTIFIPLSFLTGVEGMNLNNMPEREWDWAYPALLCFMAIIAAGMIMFFKRRKWI